MLGYILLLMLTLCGCMGFLILLTTPVVIEHEGAIIGALHALAGIGVLSVTAILTNVVQS